MMERSFIKRVKKLKLLFSLDTFVFVLSFIVIVYYTNWVIDFETLGKSVLDSFITVSSTFFAFILTGLTIITSFTDKDFILAWIKIGEYEKVITLFEYNLYVSMALLLIAFGLRYVHYNSIVMIFLISLFVYMIVAVLDLVKFIAIYAIQRGEFVELTN